MWSGYGRYNEKVMNNYKNNTRRLKNDNKQFATEAKRKR